MTIRKSEIEKEIRTLQERAEKIGLSIDSFVVNDKKYINELEKCDVGAFHRKIKPAFVSHKNYKGRKINWLPSNEYGRIYGIKFLRRINQEKTNTFF